jgi:uncharacterized protein (DUF1330 family)
MAKGYWIAQIDVKDAERYKDYVSTAAPAFKKYGAKFLARGGKVMSLEGRACARNVIIEFPSLQAALECYNCDQYQAAKAIRVTVSDGSIMLVEGVD